MTLKSNFYDDPVRNPREASRESSFLCLAGTVRLHTPFFGENQLGQIQAQARARDFLSIFTSVKSLKNKIIFILGDSRTFILISIST